jgi:hypothetical protein
LAAPASTAEEVAGNVETGTPKEPESLVTVIESLS